MAESETAAPHPTHEARHGITDIVRRWTAGPDALTRDSDAPETGPERDHLPARIPYTEIEGIQVIFDPTRFDQARHRCIIRARGGWKISIPSTFYRGIADFEDRRATFDPFVATLIERLRAAKPRARIRGGLTWPVFLMQFGGLAAVFFLLFVLLDMMGGAATTLFWLKAGILLASLVPLWRYARRNMPHDLVGRTGPKPNM